MNSRLLEWVRGSLAPISSLAPEPSWDDLALLGEMIGDASVVALSEAVHGAAQPLEFRNRLLRYLVEAKGFSAIALESGIVESRCIHEYVRGGSERLDAVIRRGLSWTFDRLPQNGTLIEWLRTYNTDPRHRRKVNFYGFDVPGCPSSIHAHFGHGTALDAALRFLDQVDDAAARSFRQRLRGLLERARFHPRRHLDPPCYAALDQSQRDTLTAAIADLIAWLDRHETRYATAATADDYAWACRAAIGARQMDHYLRQVPLHWTPSQSPNSGDESPDFFSAARDVRDRAQADNLAWIIQREGPAGKVLIFASRYHLSTAPLKVSWQPHHREQRQEVAGTYLRRALGQRLVVIGNLIGQGTIASGGEVRLLGSPPALSLEAMAANAGAACFLLDLRNAPEDVADELHREHELVAGTGMIKVAPGRAYDILLYIDSVTPAFVQSTPAGQV